MSSIAETDLNAGFSVLLDLHGESLTFRGQTITGLVDRAPGMRPDAPKVPDFSEREQSVIEVLRSAVNPLPRSGETATDNFGHNHRVVTVEPRGDTYRLHCKVTS